MAALQGEHKAVHLFGLSLQPCLPSGGARSHGRRSRARKAKAGVLVIPERLAIGDAPSNTPLQRTIGTGIFEITWYLVGAARR